MRSVLLPTKEQKELLVFGAESGVIGRIKSTEEKSDGNENK
jgi:hypothetical protein